MFKLFEFLKSTIKNPRNFMFTFQFSYRFVIRTVLSMFLIIAGIRTFQIAPVLNAIFEDIEDSAQYIPSYTYEDQQYHLLEGEKPLYYSSTSFQLVIDPTIDTTQKKESIQLTRQQKELIDTKTDLNLFIFKDRVFFSSFGRLNELPKNNLIYNDSNALRFMIQSIASSRLAIFVSSFIVQFIITIPFYLFEVMILALFFGFFNTFLNNRLSYRSRYRIGLYIYFVPTIVVELILLFIPSFGYGYFIKMLLSMLIIYYVFKDHTYYIRRMMKDLDATTIEHLIDKVSHEVHRRIDNDKSNDNDKSDIDK